LKLLNAFTVDVEDYYQVQGIGDLIGRDRWDQYESRVVASTHKVLELLDRHRVRGTFFVLGWVADRHPQLVREIVRSGHELGCHGYSHRLIYEQSPEQFRADLQRARGSLEDAVGERVAAYRAPTFSITERSLWALDVLAEEGFEIDASVFPVHHDRYGIPGAEPAAHRIAASGGLLWEFPSTVLRFAGFNVPVSGGGYFRLYPVRWTNRFLGTVNRKLGRPFVFYVHPWELDPEQPRLKVGSWTSRARHYLNLSSTQRKLDTLLSTFRFGPLTEVIGQLQPPDDCPFSGQRAAGSPRRVGPAAGEESTQQGNVELRLCSCCQDCLHNRRNGTNGTPRCAARVFERVPAA
jgi:polysaccharide deacetylase family protein (PEP-CTERM system associated)